MDNKGSTESSNISGNEVLPTTSNPLPATDPANQATNPPQQVITTNTPPARFSLFRTLLIALIPLTFLLLIGLGYVLLQNTKETKTAEKKPVTTSETGKYALNSKQILTLVDCLKSVHAYEKLHTTPDETIDAGQQCRWTMGVYKEQVDLLVTDKTQEAIPLLKTDTKEETSDTQTLTPNDFVFVKPVSKKGNSLNTWIPVFEQTYDFRFSYPANAQYSGDITPMGATITLSFPSKQGKIVIETDKWRSAFRANIPSILQEPEGSIISDPDVYPVRIKKGESQIVDTYAAFDFQSQGDKPVYGTVVNNDGYRFVVWTDTQQLISIKNDLLSTIVFIDKRGEKLKLRNTSFETYQDETLPFSLHYPVEWQPQVITSDKDKTNPSARTLVFTDTDGNNGLNIVIGGKSTLCQDKECSKTETTTTSGLSGDRYTWLGGSYFVFHLDDQTDLVIEPLYGTLQESIDAVINSLAKTTTEETVTIGEITTATSQGKDSCPTTTNFVANIYASGKGTIQYKWVRSDGAVGPIETIAVNGDKMYPVSTTWTIGRDHFSGWEKVEILSPVHMFSDQADFTMSGPKCE